MYEKDKVFYKYYLDLEDKNVLYENENTKARISFYTPFLHQKKDIALYNIKASSELVHADVTDIRFFLSQPLIQNIAYWLWIFSLLKHLSRNLELFYRDIQPKTEQTAKYEKMRLQTDLEFRQNEIKKLNKNLTLKCLAAKYLEEKHTLPNRKLEKSENFFSEVNDCINELLLNVSIQEN